MKRDVLTMVLVAATILLATMVYAQQPEFYVLDGFGGVHAGGGAPAPPAGIPYFGFDVAEDIVYVPGATGDGLLVLDSLGGVHPAGLGVVTSAPPYFGFDIARAITDRSIPPRASGNLNTGALTVSSATYASLLSTSIDAPDDGFVLLTSTAEVFCETLGPGAASSDFSIGLDSATTPLTSFEYGVRLPDCSVAVGGSRARNILAISHLLPVTAGAHTLHLLAVDRGAGVYGRVADATIVALYVHHGASAVSLPSGSTPESR